MPKEIVADLRSAGHDAESVSDEGLDGADDAILLARIQSEMRTLLTMDKGIADVRAYLTTVWDQYRDYDQKRFGRSAVAEV